MYGTKTDDRRAPPAPIRRGIGELLDERMAGQERLDDGTLGPRAPAVDETHLAETSAGALLQVVVDDARDVARGEGVQVERLLDGQDDLAFIVWPINAILGHCAVAPVSMLGAGQHARPMKNSECRCARRLTPRREADAPAWG